MTINKHSLIHAQDAGNGYHGYCEYCKLPLVTDLGYCSWDNSTCIDREVVNKLDIPSEVLRYANWHNLHWNNDTKLFVRPYTTDEYTIDQIQAILLSINVFES